MLVTDPRYDDEQIVRVVKAAAVVPGFSVQLRDRSDRSNDALYPLAKALREITERVGALFVVNRRLALARRVSADGFHAPVSELADEFVWRSAPAHDDEELLRVVRAGATAALVSPIFAGKEAPRGVSALTAARAAAPNLALVALGGVDVTNAGMCFDAGADAVAVVRALLDAPDPMLVAKCLVR